MLYALIMSSSSWLHLCLLFVAISGMILNASLILWVRRFQPAQGASVRFGFVCGLVAHLAILSAAYWTIATVFEVPEEDRESVLYYVGSFVLAFLSVPTGILAFHFHNKRSKDG